MAFKKPITARGTSGSYFRLEKLRWDKAAREASATFALYVDEAHAAAAKARDASQPRGAASPLVEVAAKIRIAGEDFDRFFARTSPAKGDIEAGFYRAAREACALVADGRSARAGLHLVSDYGSDLFVNAADA